MSYYVRDYDRSYIDQDFDLHTDVISPKETAGSHTLQAEPVFAPGNGPGINGRWRLAEKSPGHNDGPHRPNFNDDFGSRGPDRGAHENGASDLKYGTE